jgi:hypothetical protein
VALFQRLLGTRHTHSRITCPVTGCRDLGWAPIRREEGIIRTQNMSILGMSTAELSHTQRCAMAVLRSCHSSRGAVRNAWKFWNSRDGTQLCMASCQWETPKSYSAHPCHSECEEHGQRSPLSLTLTLNQRNTGCHVATIGVLRRCRSPGFAFSCAASDA